MLALFQAKPRLVPPEPPAAADPAVVRAVRCAYEIKARYVDPERDWYRTHRVFPVIWFRATGFLIIVLSAALPAVSTYDWGKDGAKTVTVAVLSVSIAALAGLSSFFKWEKTWRGRVMSRFTIDAACGKWELELENAYTLPTVDEQLKHVYLATSDLLANFRSIGAAESEEFFSGLQFPQSDRAGQNSKLVKP